MSIIQKVKVNNDWVTVKGGTSTSKKEIYIGAEEPTDANVKLWIDTDEEYEGGEGGEGGGSGTSGVETIYMPAGAIELSPSQLEHNIAVREILMACYNYGGIPPKVQFIVELEGTLLMAFYPSSMLFDTTPIFIMLEGGMFALLEDGNVIELE